MPSLAIVDSYQPSFRPLSSMPDEAWLYFSNFESEEVPSLAIVDTYQPSGPYPVFSILLKLWR